MSSTLYGKIASLHDLTLSAALDQVKRLMPRRHFYMRLIPPRPTFAADMTPEERGVMQQHVVYIHELFQKGNVLIFGPVLDPADNFGMGVFEADNEAEVRSLMESDPSVRCGLNRFAIFPMIVGAARGKAGDDAR